jgi:hypothetical protein
LIAALSVALGLLVVTPAISLDDPFIGLRYARNLVDGHGLVYNAGEPPVEGYTAFLWVLVAALGMALGFEPLAFWQVGGVLAQVATLWATYRLGRERGPARALLAPALLGGHVAFVFYPMTGMETSFFTLAVTVGALLVAERAAASRSGGLLLGLVLLVACLTRFDGIGLAGLLAGWILLADRDRRGFVRVMIPLLGGLLVYHGWRLAFYGDPLPNTFYAKVFAFGDRLSTGARYALRFLLRGGPFLLLLAAPLALRGRAGRTARLSGWLCLGQLAYVLFAGGDWMPYYRFVLPVLPLLCLLVQEVVWGLVDRGREAGRALPGAASGLLVAAVLLLGLLPLAASTFVRRPPPGPYWDAAEARWIARRLDGLLPADALVAVEWAGIIPFHLRQPVLDIFGLSDKEITSADFAASRMGRGIPPEFLAGRRPEVVIFTARTYRSGGEAAAIGPDVRGEGLWITDFYRRLLRPEHGYAACVVDLGSRRFWPVLVLADSPVRRRLCQDVE